MAPGDLDGRKMLAAQRLETLRRAGRPSPLGGLVRRWIGGWLLAAGARLAGPDASRVRGQGVYVRPGRSRC